MSIIKSVPPCVESVAAQALYGAQTSRCDLRNLRHTQAGDRQGRRSAGIQGLEPPLL
jgi:hypothetical protein